MNTQAKNDIRSKARLTYGLLNILKYDIDTLRADAKDFDGPNLLTTVRNTNRTLQNLADVMAEIEYILYLNGVEESL